MLRSPFSPRARFSRQLGKDQKSFREAKATMDGLFEHASAQMTQLFVQADIDQIALRSAELGRANGELNTAHDKRDQSTGTEKAGGATALHEADVAVAIASAMKGVVDVLTQRFSDTLKPELTRALAETERKARKGQVFRWLAGFATGVAASLVAALLYTWVPLLWVALHVGP